MRTKQTPLSLSQSDDTEYPATMTACDASTLEAALQCLAQFPSQPNLTGPQPETAPSLATMDSIDGVSLPSSLPMPLNGALDLSTKPTFSLHPCTAEDLKLEEDGEDMDSSDSQFHSMKTTPVGGMEGAMSSSPPVDHHFGDMHGLSGFGPLSEHTLVCVECRKTFRFEKNFLRHMQKAHATGEGESVLKCKLCNYTTKHYSNMYVHIRTHTGDKPYFCAGCGANFTQGSSLKLHIKSRHGDKPGYFCLTKKPGKNNLTKLWTRVLKKDLGRLNSLPGPGHHMGFSPMGHLGMDSGPFGMFPPPPQFYHGGGLPMMPPHFVHPQSHGYHPTPQGFPGGPPFRPAGFGPESFVPGMGHPALRPPPSIGEGIVQRFGSFLRSPVKPTLPTESLKLETSGSEDVSTDTSMIDLNLKDLHDKPSSSPISEKNFNKFPTKEASELSEEFSSIQSRLRSVLQQLQAHNPHLLQDSDPALRNQLLSLLGLPTAADSSPFRKMDTSTSSADHPPSTATPKSHNKSPAAVSTASASTVVDNLSPTYLPRLQPPSSFPPVPRSEHALFPLQHQHLLPQSFQANFQQPGLMMPFHPLHPALRS